MSTSDLQPSQPIKAEIRLRHLETAARAQQRLGKMLDLPLLMREITLFLVETTGYQRVMCFVHDEANHQLQFGALFGTEPPKSLNHTFISLLQQDQDDIFAHAMQEGQSLNLSEAVLEGSPSIQYMKPVLQPDNGFALPLHQQRLVGMLLFDHHRSEPNHQKEDQELLKAMSPTIGIILENARVHSKTVQELAAKMRELYILRQIDRELNDNVQQDHVFSMTLDWALRFTNASAASLAMYDEESDQLRYVANIGYKIDHEKMNESQSSEINTMHRVARNGRAEIIPDLTLEYDAVRFSGQMQSQLSLPVMREDRVIAVIGLESKKLNAFTEEHLDFLDKLAARAGVAIDNARLFDQTAREGEKLSGILDNIADVVIVLTHDGRIVLINQSALAALHMYGTADDYIGRPASEVFEDSPLYEVVRKAVASKEGMITEIPLTAERTFHINISPYAKVGWIVTLHDITPLKETDRLKSELVATVSHDLKQPLSVMHGYSDLLLMRPSLDTQSQNYTRMIQRSIQNMRTLIDDLLNLARIESGIQLLPQPVRMASLLEECVANVQPSADQKAMTMTMRVPEDLPPVKGDRSYLSQIFLNLISNAVKYTPPEGKVNIWAERHNDHVRINVQDSGLGISPEDQARIFERFYRVRRSETESIEGTGLGLSIVKRLIELHNGQIGLSSQLNSGSTFYVLLPIYT